MQVPILYTVTCSKVNSFKLDFCCFLLYFFLTLNRNIDCGYMNWVWKDYEARKECTGIHEPRLKKINSVASEQVRHNLVCTVTDDG